MRSGHEIHCLSPHIKIVNLDIYDCATKEEIKEVIKDEIRDDLSLETKESPFATNGR